MDRLKSDLEASQGAQWLKKKKKNLPANTRGCRRRGFNPELGRSPGEGNGNLLQLFLPGYSHGQRSLVGYSPWGCKGVTYDLVNKQ